MSKKLIAAAMLAGLLSFGAAPTWADPGSGSASGGGLGTGSSGAPIDKVGTGSSGAPIDKIGTGSPDYSKPAPEPKKDSPEHGAWEAGERARIANLENSKGRDNSPSICSTDKTSANYCRVAGDDE